MGGLDAIVFGGGIGLNSPLVRALSLEGLEFLDVRLDGFKNRMAIAGMDISMEDAPVRVFTVHTDEEIIVAPKGRRHCWLHIDKQLHPRAVSGSSRIFLKKLGTEVRVFSISCTYISERA